MAVRQVKDGRWIVYWAERGQDGKRRIKQIWCGRGPEGEALARKKNEEMGFLARRPAKESAPAGPLFYELAKSYSITKPFNVNSFEHLTIRLQANILPFFGERPAAEITEHTADQYVKKRLDDGVKYSTIARELTDIKAILSWSASRDLIPKNPLERYKKPKEDLAVIAPPSLEEAERIFSEASPHIRRVILLSVYVGVRPGRVELFSLTWKAVDWDSGTIAVSSARKGGPSTRIAPASGFLSEQMRQWFDEDRQMLEAKADSPTDLEKLLQDLPIVHYNGQPVKKIKHAWANTLRRAGIRRRLRPYDLRHYFVTRALEAGSDLKAVSEIAGSSPVTIMRHYHHVSDALRRRVVESLAPIQEKKKAKK